jgi:hypothetical protein
MTTPAEPPTTGPPAPTTAVPDEPQSQAEPTPEPEPTPNSEAARYRVQLREAETQRDALAERLTGYQRRECEAVVADVLDVPADLWEVAQADITAFYNDDGTVNETELIAAATALVEQRPRLGKPVPQRQWGQAGDIGHTGGGISWGTVIGPS